MHYIPSVPLFMRAYGHGLVNAMTLNTAVITIPQGAFQMKTSKTL